MDTIDNNVMQEATEKVLLALHNGLPIIHTVTITLNGATGGADVILRGFDTEDDPLTVMTQIGVN